MNSPIRDGCLSASLSPSLPLLWRLLTLPWQRLYVEMLISQIPCHVILAHHCFPVPFHSPILMSNALVFIHAGFVCVTNFLSLSSLTVARNPLPCFHFHLCSFICFPLTLAQSILCLPSFFTPSPYNYLLLISLSNFLLLFLHLCTCTYPSVMSFLGLSFSLRVQSLKQQSMALSRTVNIVYEWKL